MSANDDWVKTVFQEANGEVQLAFNQLHTNINWALIILSAIFTGVIVRGHFDITTLGLTLFSLVLTIGFFIRSTLGYTNLYRWNTIRSTSLAYLESADAQKPGLLEKLRLEHEAYALPKWYTVISRKDAIKQNARFFRLWPLLGAIGFAAIYQVYYMTKGFSQTSSFDRAGLLAASGLIFLVIVYEISSLYDGSFFKKVKANRVSIDEADRRAKFKDPDSRRLLYYGGAALMVLSVVVLAAGAQSASIWYSTPDFKQASEYSILQIPTVPQAVGTLQWQSYSPHVVGILPVSHLSDLNRSMLANATSLEYGTNGTLSVDLDTPSVLFSTGSGVAVAHITYQADSYSTNPLLDLSLLASSAALLSSVLWKSRLKKSQDVYLDSEEQRPATEDSAGMPRSGSPMEVVPK